MSRNTVIDQVKTWLTPGLVAILGMFIWRDLGELRTDVKKLLAQSTEDHTKITRMEEDIHLLKQKVFIREVTYLHWKDYPLVIYPQHSYNIIKLPVWSKTSIKAGVPLY